MKKFTYEEAVAYIHASYGTGSKNGLENMRLLLEKLGNPQNSYPCVHIAGTNGKGSTCAFVNNILQCAGYRVGLYTSPYLQKYNERVRLNGKPIEDEKLAELMALVAEAADSLHAQNVFPTEFEIGTALAFLFFRDQRVDAAVIEVGLGGRLDPTNVIEPVVTAITSIGMDHMQLLGNTLPLIAMEKAGIAKRDVPMVISEGIAPDLRQLISNHCEKLNAGVVYACREKITESNLKVGLYGQHQITNASTALEICMCLKKKGFAISESAVKNGLAGTRWPARLEWAGNLLMDGAHNAEGAQALRAYLQEDTEHQGRRVLLCGVMRDKEWQVVMQTLAPYMQACVAVKPDNPRALPAQELADYLFGLGMESHAASDLKSAYEEAKMLAGEKGYVIAAGSLYLVGALRTLAIGTDDSLFVSV